MLYLDCGKESRGVVRECVCVSAASASASAREQVAYIMDALRYREGTLGAVWVTLGLANLGMLAAVLLPAFTGSRPLLLALLSSLCTGATLFLTGARPASAPSAHRAR